MKDQRADAILAAYNASEAVLRKLKPEVQVSKTITGHFGPQCSRRKDISGYLVSGQKGAVPYKGTHS